LFIRESRNRNFLARGPTRTIVCLAISTTHRLIQWTITCRAVITWTWSFTFNIYISETYNFESMKVDGEIVALKEKLNSVSLKLNNNVGNHILM
jgi:hypothetical protein